MKSFSRQPSRPWYRKPESWHDDQPQFDVPMLYLDEPFGSDIELRLLVAGEAAVISVAGSAGPSSR